jgi:hypothetical protein
MIHNAIKEYLHKASITNNEVELIKELLKDGKETLKDFLPKDKASYFLIRLLRAALTNHKDNKEFINDIISLKNENNKDSLYFELKQHKYGLEIIKNNPTLFVDDLNKLFKDLLDNGSSKPIVDFVKINQEKINTELIYEYPLDVSIILSLEKIGLNFDDRIINTVINKKNYKKPDKLLAYIANFESTCNEKTWNNGIIKMLSYYNHQIWDDYGKHKFIDSFSIITKLKNPNQYSWGKDLGHWECFNFDNSLYAFINNRGFSGYLDNNKPGSLSDVKEFIKKNDIYFTHLKGQVEVFSAFLDDFSDSVFEKTIKDSWPEMFDFQEMEEIRRKRNTGLHRDTAIFDNLNSNNVVIKNVLQNERFRKFVLKEYFANKKYRLRSYKESSFFEALGLEKEEILNNNALSKYSNSLNKENVEYILDKLHLDKKEREIALMNYEMRKDDDFSEPQSKKFKI